MRQAMIVTLIAIALGGPASAGAATPSGADRVFINGTVHTIDAKDNRAEAVAIKDGRIVYVGTSVGARADVTGGTEVTDLRGRFLMPGLIDAHMHPFEGGQQLTKCNLEYKTQTVPQFQAAIQQCLDRTRQNEPDDWLEVVNWNQEVMLPTGIMTDRGMLDALKTTRPIIVLSSQGHAGLANSRALKLGNITASTPDPVGGRLYRGPDGMPTGLLDEPAAYEMVTRLLPKLTPEQGLAAAAAACAALNSQGVTSVLDAWARTDALEGFTALQKAGRLTVRAHFAPPINPDEAGALEAAINRIVGLRQQYDQGPEQPAPGITVRDAKLFLDGVIYAPALSGVMVDPYFQNTGTADKPNWVPGTSRGPAVYFAPDVLAAIVTGLARQGIDAHMHADGDGAVRAALDAVAVLRKSDISTDIRPAIAHDEIVTPADFPRFRELNVTAAIGFQWAQPAGYTLGLTNYFGPARMKIIEPQGLLANAGARLSLGSDWPVDALDEWFDFQVAVTRHGPADAAPEFRGRLGDDPGLSMTQVLRAATINAAYQLHEDEVTGSIEVGKFADLIVLDRNPLTARPGDIARVRVLETLVGGKVVHRAEPQQSH